MCHVANVLTIISNFLQSVQSFNVTTGVSGNYSRSNRPRNLREKSYSRTGDRNSASRSHTEPSSSTPEDTTQNQIARYRDTPSTSTPSTVQPSSSNTVERVDDDNPPRQHEHSAEQVTKKLIHQLTSMNKYNLKQMINNPSTKYETVLQSHARNRIRAEIRTKLQNMSADQENQLVNNVLNNVIETEESVDLSKIQEVVIEDIGRVLDINLLGDSADEDNDVDDRDRKRMEYPRDLYLRAEQLLMESSIIFRHTPIKIKDEIKEEPDEIDDDDNFFEIQDNDNWRIEEFVFEDREGSVSLPNDNLADQLNEISDKDETYSEHCVSNNSNDISGEMVRVPPTLFIKEENCEVERYKEVTNNNVKDICLDRRSRNSSQSSSKLYKSQDRQRSNQSSSSTNNYKTTTSDDFHQPLLVNVKQERDTDAYNFNGRIYSATIGATTQEPPKKIDLFTKLQNSGAFQSTPVKRRDDTNLESTDYKRDNSYSRKKKKKHKSRPRSRSITRLRSRSRSPMRSRNSNKSKKSSRDRSRKRDRYAVDDSESKNTSKMANVELSYDSLINPSEQTDELNNKITENVEPMNEEYLNKTETSNHVIQEVIDGLVNAENIDMPDEGAPNFKEATNMTETILDNIVMDIQGIEPSSSDAVPNLNEETDKMEMEQPVNENDSIREIGEEIIMETVNEIVAQEIDEIVKKSVEVTIMEDVKETVVEDVKDIVMEDVKDIVMEYTVDLIDRVTNTATETTPNTIIESVDEKAVKTIIEDIMDLEASLPIATPMLLTDEIDKFPNPPTKSSEVTVVIGEESSASIGSLSVENSITLNSGSQSSIPDDVVDLASLKSTQPQKSNVVAIRKFVLKPSSRHQKSSSKHKCEKERHVSSSHKTKKSETNTTSSKKGKILYFVYILPIVILENRQLKSPTFLCIHKNERPYKVFISRTLGRYK